MKQRENFSALLLVTAALLAGCGGAEGWDEEPLGEARGELLNPNALSPDALNAAVLTDTGAGGGEPLHMNALSPDALNAVAPAALNDPGRLGDLTRQLMKYALECALDPSQSFTFSWTDGQGVVHPEAYRGLVGIEPKWLLYPLTEKGQAWVSACIASRVNWYGLSLTISARSAHPRLNPTTSAELSNYTMREGAFWGNLFVQNPHLHACYYAPNIAHSRSRLRDCATGHLDPATNTVEDCGILDVVGSCADHCDPIITLGTSYPGCSHDSGGETIKQVVTAYLQ